MVTVFVGGLAVRGGRAEGMCAVEGWYVREGRAGRADGGSRDGVKRLVRKLDGDIVLLRF